MIDLKQLNQSLAPVTFTMDTLSLVKKSLRKGMWATSIDLSDAYHHIPIRASSQVYLCFQVGDKRYRYLVLPFGLMSAPWLFTQVVKQLKRWAAKHCVALFQYLDDWLNVNNDKAKLVKSTQELVSLCERLGLLVNVAKSELEPRQKIVFLGELLDLETGLALATPTRQSEVRERVFKAITTPSLPLRVLESTLGLLGATYPTVPWGRLYLRKLQGQVLGGIAKGRSVTNMVEISQETRDHLQFWLQDQVWLPGSRFSVALPA